MCVVIPFILDVRLVDVPARVTQEEGHAEFLHLSSAVFALIFLARRIQPFLSLVDRVLDFVYKRVKLIFLHYFLGFFFFVRKNLSSCDDTEIRTHVPTSEGLYTSINRHAGDTKQGMLRRSRSVLIFL